MNLPDSEIERLGNVLRGRLSQPGGADYNDLARAVVAALPASEWATPEAKALLDHLESFSDDWFVAVPKLARLMCAYLAGRKPKTITLPERWIVEVSTSTGLVPFLFFTKAAADAHSKEHGGYVRGPLPAETREVA